MATVVNITNCIKLQPQQFRNFDVPFFEPKASSASFLYHKACLSTLTGRAHLRWTLSCNPGILKRWGCIHLSNKKIWQPRIIQLFKGVEPLVREPWFLDRRAVHFHPLFVPGDWPDIVDNVNKAEFVHLKHCVIHVFLYLNLACCVWTIDTCFSLWACLCRLQLFVKCVWQLTHA